MKGLAGMSLADLDQESSDHSSGQTKRARESSDSLSSTTNLPQKREQHEVTHDMQGGKAKKTTTGTSTPTSYAGAVKASNQIPLRWFPVVMQKSVVRIWKQSIQQSGTKGCYV